ncbi:MAG: hypothetical protein ACREBD_33900, partial [Blastocatellia bacterium]
ITCPTDLGRSVKVMTAETILQEVRLWPRFEQLKLLMLLFEQVEQAQALTPTDEDRRAAFRRVRGKYKHLLPTVAEFQAEKRQEPEFEERRYAERFGRRTEAQR